MGAFNRLQFDLGQFNINPASEVWISATFAERISSLIATSEKSYIYISGQEAIHSDVSMANPGRMLRISGSEIVDPQPLRGGVYFKASGSEAVSIENSISFLTWMKNVLAESISQSGTISSCFWTHVAPSESVDTDDYIGQSFFEKGESTEVVDTSVSAVVLDEFICELGVTLKPGQTLIVDAGNYNVLLDGQNAIHLQSGNWLDELNRETKNIRVTADYPSNLSASILYTERYL